MTLKETSHDLDPRVTAPYSPYMEVDVELSRKTTILFSPELHRRLSQLAARRGRHGGGLEAVCSYDRDFDRIKGIVRTSSHTSTAGNRETETRLHCGLFEKRMIRTT